MKQNNWKFYLKCAAVGVTTAVVYIAAAKAGVVAAKSLKD